MREPLLRLDGLSMTFGGVIAVNDLDLTIEEGEIMAVIGPNGAGKTTVFNCVTGVFRPTAGRVVLDGKRINGLRPHRITRTGIARTFQNIRLFAKMTAFENVQVGADAHHRASVPGALFGSRRHRAEEADGRSEARRLLSFVGLGNLGGELASNLSYGDQRRLEIARALAARPRLLLLDEPAAGMNQAEKQALMELIRSVRDSGVTVLLIEHDMNLVMGISDRVAVLNFGAKIADAAPAVVRSDPAVIAAYLGEPADAG